MQMGEMMAMTLMMMGENQSCQSQFHVTAFGVLRVKHPKVGLNRQPIAYTGGVGLGSHPIPNHLIGKQTVNTTLVKFQHMLLQYTKYSLRS